MNNMKNLQISARLLLSIAFLISLSGIVSANGELSVANLGISPQPVVAGQNITISFQLYDSYSAVTNVDMALSGGYPLLNFSPTGTQFISSMGNGLYGGLGTYFVYHIQIPKNVQSGTYTIDVVANYQISTTSSGSTTNVAASSVMPITFYISGVPNIVLSASPTTPLIPGSTFTATITALNIGTASATSVNATILSSANFSVTGTSKISFGAVNAGGAATATATLQANRSLTQGSNFIPVALSYTTQYGANINKTVKMPISVLVSQPNFVASIVSAQPQTLNPGSNQTLTVAVQNIGVGLAKNVSVRFLSTPYITVGSSATDIFIGTIPAGSSVSESVFIIANKRDNLTNYPLPVKINYANANYQNSTTSTTNLNISLQKTAQFTILNVTDALKPASTYAPITFVVKNTGNEVAQQITFSLQTIYPISPVNPNVYINSLEPGESKNITFYVNVDTQGNVGEYPVSIYEQWSQPSSTTSAQYSSSQNYYGAVYSSGSSGSSSSGSLLPYLVVVVIVAAAGIYYYKKIMPEKKAKPAK